MLRRGFVALLTLSTCRGSQTEPFAVHTVASAETSPTHGPKGAPPAEAPTVPKAASSEPTLAQVDIQTIGMHIGGGPNDDVTKAPFLGSIEAHRAAFVRCFAALPGAPTGDFGVDARVPAKGGRAKIDRPRSTVPDTNFKACAQAAFAEIEFDPPKSGLATMVSVSVRGSRKR